MTRENNIEGFIGQIAAILSVMFPKRYDQHVIAWRWNQFMKQYPADWLNKGVK